MGTNDFNDGVPIGEWFTETEEQVMAARGQVKRLETRKKRTPIMDGNTYKGRINIGINRLKQLFPDKQIVLLTPLHRSLADFGEKNVQPDETIRIVVVNMWMPTCRPSRKPVMCGECP